MCDDRRKGRPPISAPPQPACEPIVALTESRSNKHFAKSVFSDGDHSLPGGATGKRNPLQFEEDGSQARANGRDSERNCLPVPLDRRQAAIRFARGTLATANRKPALRQAERARYTTAAQESRCPVRPGKGATDCTLLQRTAGRQGMEITRSDLLSWDS